MGYLSIQSLFSLENFGEATIIVMATKQSQQNGNILGNNSTGYLW